MKNERIELVLTGSGVGDCCGKKAQPVMQLELRYGKNKRNAWCCESCRNQTFGLHLFELSGLDMHEEIPF